MKSIYVHVAPVVNRARRRWNQERYTLYRHEYDAPHPPPSTEPQTSMSTRATYLGLRVC
ncbi:hypothetical protein BDN70DRAFT_888317 [Pholiota conissans]|uniref:Uncharacterized protein n=1 Tax=Pholiota conissans TaxID=109636 RepID=A0A9P6CLK9_9AGAR|nr:hypothetical protein BDN70DRAFT_888317 [Pholiota conissans]